MQSCISFYHSLLLFSYSYKTMSPNAVGNHYHKFTYFVTPLAVSTGKNVSNSCAAGTVPLLSLFVIMVYAIFPLV